MTKFKSGLTPRSVAFSLSVLASAALVACGGSGSSAPPATTTLSGTAASGAAIANALLLAECVGGSNTTTTTSSGDFSLTVTGSAPCVLSVTVNGNVLFGTTNSAGRVNVTPLSALVVEYLKAFSQLGSGAQPADLLGSSAYRAAVANAQTLGDAVVAVRNQLQSTYGVDVGVNFLNEEIKTPVSGAQNAQYQKLDQLRAQGAFDANGRPSENDRQNVSQRGSEARAAASPAPSASPTSSPTATPTAAPTTAPTAAPTNAPTNAPTAAPTAGPTASPTSTPTNAPTTAPTAAPTPAPTSAPAASGPASECFNSSLAQIGSMQTLNYRSTANGATVNTSTTVEIVRNTTFEGNNATEQKSTTSGIETFVYFALDGLTSRTFGSTTSIAAGGFTTDTKVVFNPPSENRDFTLVAGGNYNRTDNSTTTISVAGTNQSSSASSTTTVTYQGQESVTVPAGTFTACRFTSVENANGTQTTTNQWIAKPAGVAVKSVSDSGTTELVSGSINGVAIQ